MGGRKLINTILCVAAASCATKLPPPKFQHTVKTPAAEQKRNIVLGKSSKEGLIQDCMVMDDKLAYHTQDKIPKTFPLLLEPGEVAKEVSCSGETSVVLTNTSLVAVRDMSQGCDGNICLEYQIKEVDMSDIYRRGIITWTHSDEQAFVLTHDRKLAVIYLDPEISRTDGFEIPEATAGSRMISYKGILFIGSGSTIVANTFHGKRASYERFQIEGSFSNPDFSVEETRLFYGDAAQRVEISVKSKKIDDIEISSAECGFRLGSD